MKLSHLRWKIRYSLGPFGIILCWFGSHSMNFNGRCWYCGYSDGPCCNYRE